jgi:DNA primase
MRWCDICQRPWSFAYCGHQSAQRQPRPLLPTPSSVPCAAPAILDRVYRELLAALPLLPSHHQALRQRGLADVEIFRRRYRTLPIAGRTALAKRLVDQIGADLCIQVPGFYIAERHGRRWWSLAGAAGLLIPVHNLDGHIVALKVRVDIPGYSHKYTMVSSAKHEGPSPGAPVHVPLHDGVCGDTVRLTEGELKADIATVLSETLTVALPGVAMWRKALAVLQHLQSPQVLLAFDADWRTNPHVAQALGQAAFALVALGYTVEVEAWELALGKGIDDLMAAGHTPTRQSVALAFATSVRGHARPWTGQLRTVAAEEIPPWR